MYWGVVKLKTTPKYETVGCLMETDNCSCNCIDRGDCKCSPPRENFNIDWKIVAFERSMKLDLRFKCHEISFLSKCLLLFGLMGYRKFVLRYFLKHTELKV